MTNRGGAAFSAFIIGHCFGLGTSDFVIFVHG
jgi:hypothetical protein